MAAEAMRALNRLGSGLRNWIPVTVAGSLTSTFLRLTALFRGTRTADSGRRTLNRPRSLTGAGGSRPAGSPPAMLTPMRPWPGRGWSGAARGVPAPEIRTRRPPARGCGSGAPGGRWPASSGVMCCPDAQPGTQLPPAPGLPAAAKVRRCARPSPPSCSTGMGCCTSRMSGRTDTPPPRWSRPEAGRSDGLGPKSGEESA